MDGIQFECVQFLYNDLCKLIGLALLLSWNATLFIYKNNDLIWKTFCNDYKKPLIFLKVDFLLHIRTQRVFTYTLCVTGSSSSSSVWYWWRIILLCGWCAFQCLLPPTLSPGLTPLSSFVPIESILSLSIRWHHVCWSLPFCPSRSMGRVVLLPHQSQSVSLIRLLEDVTLELRETLPRAGLQGVHRALLKSSSLSIPCVGGWCY